MQIVPVTPESKKLAREALLAMVHLAKASKTPMHFMERATHLLMAAMAARELTDEQVLASIEKSEQMLGMVEVDSAATQLPGRA